MPALEAVPPSEGVGHSGDAMGSRAGRQRHFRAVWRVSKAFKLSARFAGQVLYMAFVRDPARSRAMELSNAR